MGLCGAMSYQVLARKWRPRTFAQLVGQPHVVRALSNALTQGRLHHAYLFTGTRGVGKTTLARILAKCLNCETGVTAEPCGVCTACCEIDGGRFVDLLEVDAASRTKVEDTRELLDNVPYAPTCGRYKVYLIDEVHMLSGHSFNALLKTLEEPPAHVKFLLATTDPQKLPVTVLSRCLQFNLKRLSAEAIAAHLKDILGREGLDAESAALEALARAADGSLRDALSLLDQAIAYGNGSLTVAQVHDLLGVLPEVHLYQVLTAVAQGDAGALLAGLDVLGALGPDYASVLVELTRLLHWVAVWQMVPEAHAMRDLDARSREKIAQLAERLNPQEVQLFYQIALIGRRDLPLAPDPKAGLEMILLRMLGFRPAGRKLGRSTQEAPVTSAEQAGAVRQAPSPQAETEGGDWRGLVGVLQLKGIALELASQCSLKRWDEVEVVLGLARSHAQLCTRAVEQRLQDALSAHFARPIRLRIELGEHAVETPAKALQREHDVRQRQAEALIASDQVVQAFKTSFGAQVVPGSIKPTIKPDGG